MDERIDFAPAAVNCVFLTDTQRAKVERTIDLVKADIQDIGGQIQRLNVELARHVQHLERLEAARSPIKQLPAEVLAKIIATSASCSASVHHRSSDCSFTLPFMNQYSPWVARQVSSDWREVSLRQSNLWNHIGFTAPDQTKKFAPRLGKVKPWNTLLRVAHTIIPKNGSVYLSIDFSEMNAPLESDYVDQTLRSFYAAYKDRLKHIELIGDSLGFAPLVGTFSVKRFEFLESLSLCQTGNDDDLQASFTRSDAKCFYRAKSLRSLTIRLPDHHTFRFHTKFMDRIPWKQLHHLTMDCPASGRTQEDFPFIYLAQCTNLATTTLRIVPRARHPVRDDATEADDEDAWITDQETDEEDTETDLSSDDSIYESESDSDTSNSSASFNKENKSSPRLSLAHYRQMSLFCSLPNLTTLNIFLSETKHCSIGSCFARLCLPQLQHICVSVADYDALLYTSFLASMTDLLRRSECKLLTLVENPRPASVSNVLQSPSLFEGMLETVNTSLEEFHTCAVVPAATLKKIANGDLLPRLRAFKFCAETKNPYDTLEILEKRFGWVDPTRHAFCGLRKVRMVVRSGSSSDSTSIATGYAATMRKVKEKKEADRKGFELHIGSKQFTAWTDISF